MVALNCSCGVSIVVVWLFPDVFCWLSCVVYGLCVSIVCSMVSVVVHVFCKFCLIVSACF